MFRFRRWKRVYPKRDMEKIGIAFAAGTGSIIAVVIWIVLLRGGTV
jgi:hypothetical protein